MIIYMMIGLPGSGKSHWIRKHMPDIPVVCPDEIRFEVFGIKDGYPDPKHEPYVWASVWREIEMLLSAGAEEIIFDATNVRKIHRSAVFLRFPRCAVIGIWIQTPVDVCRARRPVTETFFEDTMDKFVEMFECPTIEEGFTEIRIERGYGENKVDRRTT
jgi:predicted kinase